MGIVWSRGTDSLQGVPVESLHNVVDAEYCMVNRQGLEALQCNYVHSPLENRLKSVQ